MAEYAFSQNQEPSRKEFIKDAKFWVKPGLETPKSNLN